MRIGFAGLGRMGAPMAARLAAAGVPLTVWTRDSAKAAAFAAAHGAALAASPRALAEASDLVLTMLADDAASAAVHDGPDGLLAGRARLVAMGTHSVAHIQALAARGKLVDAPVSGATQAAEAGQLLILLGGDAALAEELVPVLGVLGRRTVALGAVGAGATMKLVINLILHGLNQTFAEALPIAEAAGIPTQAAYDAITDSAVAAPMLRYRGPLYLDEARHPVSFALDLALKDVGLALDLAAAHGVPTPQSEVTRAELAAASAAGYGARDMAALLAYCRARAAP